MRQLTDVGVGLERGAGWRRSSPDPQRTRPDGENASELWSSNAMQKTELLCNALSDDADQSCLVAQLVGDVEGVPGHELVNHGTPVLKMVGFLVQSITVLRLGKTGPDSQQSTNGRE